MKKDFQITEIISYHSRLDDLALRIAGVLEDTKNTPVIWCTVGYLRRELKYTGGGGWFYHAVEIAASEKLATVVRCDTHILVTAYTEDIIEVGDTIYEWMVRR